MRTQMHHLVAETAAGARDAPALTYEDATVSYAELWRDLARLRRRPARARPARAASGSAIYLDKRIETVVASSAPRPPAASSCPVNPLLRPSRSATSSRLRRARAGHVAPSASSCCARSSRVRVARARDRARRGAGAAAGAGYDVQPGTTSWRRPTVRRATAGSTPTWRRSSTPPAAPASRRAWCCPTATCRRRAERRQYLGTTPDDVILAALPLSFDAGFSQLTTGFTVGARVVLINYLLPRDVVRLCAKHQVTGPHLRAAAVDPARRAGVAGGGDAELRYFANTGGRMPRATLDRLRAIFPQAKPFLMYGLTEAFRSTYLTRPRSTAGPTRSARRSRTPRSSWCARTGRACEPGEEGELVHRGALVALGYWNDPERTAERFRPAPGRDGGDLHDRDSRSGRATWSARRGRLPVLRRAARTR